MRLRTIQKFNRMTATVFNGTLLSLALTACSVTHEVKEDFSITMPTGDADTIVDSRLGSMQEKVDAYPQRHDLHFEISQLYFQKEDYRSAEDALYSALSIKPDDARYCFQLGRVQFIMKEYYDAEESFEKAIAATGKASRYDGLHLMLGYTRCNLKKWDEARENFLTCTEIAPENPVPYYFLGAIADIHNDSEGVMKYMSRYLDIGGGLYSGQARKVLQYNGVVDLPAGKAKVRPSSLEGGLEQKPVGTLPGDLDIKPATGG